MSLLSWARERLGLMDGARWARYFGGEANWSGKSVTADNAMLLSPWWRSVKLHAEVVGSLPLKFYELQPNGHREQVRDHPMARLIGMDPNIDQTSQEFWGCQAASLCIFGNAYAEKLFLGSGANERLIALQPMPADTHPFRDPQTDELKYRFYDRGKSEELPREKVFHTKGFNLGGDVGMSPLAAARQTLGISLATEQAAGQTFAQGMRASGFFTAPPGIGLKQEQRDDFRKTFIDPIIGNDAKAHYGILEQGFDFKTINIPPKDAEMLLSRRFNIEEQARFMGIPPILIGHSGEGQTMWGTGVEAIIMQWRTMGLDAFLSNIEKSINKRVLSQQDRRTFFVEFDRNALSRADSAARAELYWKFAQIAAITPNQICDKENFPRFEGGDVRLVNSTLLPLAMLGQNPSPQLKYSDDQPRDPGGRFGSTGDGSQTTALHSAKEKIRETLAWAKENVAKAASSHIAKDALSFALQSLMSHGTGVLSHATGGAVPNVQGLDAGTWHLNEQLVDHAVSNFATIAAVSKAQASEAVRSGVHKLMDMRQQQVNAKLGRKAEEEPDPVLAVLQTILDALDRLDAKDKETQK